MSRVGSGQEAFEMSRVGPDRVNKFSNLAGRVGSGHEVLKNVTDWVGSLDVQNVTDRVGS